MKALARSPLVVIGDTVIGSWTIGLCFLAFLSSGDDHGTGVSADVDDIAEVAIGVVEGIVDLLLTAFCCEATPHVPLQVVCFPEFAIVTLHVDGDCDTWRSRREINFFCWDCFSTGEEFVVVA